VRYDDALYATDADGLLAVVRALDNEDNVVMLVGHNPSMEELTELLCAQSPAYPTAALGSVDLAVDRWADVAPGCGTLGAFVTPAQLDAIP
jgi:phosphohistidine phosphatase